MDYWLQTSHVPERRVEFLIAHLMEDLFAMIDQLVVQKRSVDEYD
ncbi:hypothetical protein [Leptospira levettii]|nr:hypothetical protein [Leptospira levettii]